MRFSVPVLALLASGGMASPNSIISRDVTTTEAVTEAISFAVAADDCDLLKCAAVIASAACIGASIALGPGGIPSLLGCTAGGASAICPCANCVDALGDFLKNNNVCPA
ncbi:hypothetical protein JX265_008455 [Neoarthrinium moseri]|uniref:Fungal calcium binding protein domain-containing protein n=1 Tax=Neoarthrinium moseri TaxID=1658444 RepID=A0A9P9WIA3_9PEZI|nr:uncharacterized protein JN550_001458 [Neoarthrinium moseri]KAI1843719.1 hypothetical protein JX266_010165 [Neoarthrinium moseri]KAI1864731.1 hypothetical protein JX265_008455 [Neoarthrinium moseri]KAI1875962.1 hypothetical protein JN550_001458 [Neoarthrinium moseri]